MDRVAVLDALSVAKETYLFHGIDQPLRITQSATTTTAYYELDLAGNVRHLFASSGGDLGGYRYTAFGRRKKTRRPSRSRFGGRAGGSAASAAASTT